ncbi:MAG: amino acid-binding protein [Eubacteriales bacterium]|nr:amino acid-binding protein [Eubacteriales bacterium]
MVKQLSVFLENSKGRLAHMTRILSDAGVDLLALSIADTTDFGILRAIVTDLDKAVEVLKAEAYTVAVSEVLAVMVPDKPGGLADVLRIMNDADIGVEYLYSFVRKPEESALILFKVDDIQRAMDAMQHNGLRMVEQEELLKI